ncbi:hypothetical protein [Aestuariivivens sediminis]|uniref:hypothetical protein n=1 Tax=Aestuariivivens sediminis TaxID=2913557 RepID=UPI001F55CA92|nr:hypothetical protein [Aestuariivivens sediminis]
MSIEKVNKVQELSPEWDHIAHSIYQKRSFLSHLERTNHSNQRYYTLHEKGVLCAGAVVYSLKINLFTFSKLELKLPMQVIGLPISNDESGVWGSDPYVETLLSHIFRKERGIVLCLNYAQDLPNFKTINMTSLPSMIFQIEHDSWEGYMQALRHPYRRRILKALDKTATVTGRREPCGAFTERHYELYLEVVKRSKTKLEILSMAFFKTLPEPFNLNSFYDNEKLLYWNITLEENKTLYFLFGGLDYKARDTYDSYTNNLIEIIKEGIHRECHVINLGQTAEISKARFGAYKRNNKMCLYHHNRMIRWLFNSLRNQLSYTSHTGGHRVYHEDKVPMSDISKNKMHYAGIS